jgi:signal transduction histidine kinase
LENRQNIQLRLLSYAVIAYMMMAFGWWSILLFTKNRDAFSAKRDLMRIGMVAEGLVQTDEEFYASTSFQNLSDQYRRQEYMILGEASVFVVSLVLGVWLINRGYYKEMMAAQQRRNFLLSITHELKSPIASIQLVLETFLRRMLTKELSERLTNNALKETERLNVLVNDLLLSAKLETAYTPHNEPLDLAELVEDLVEKLRDKYPNAQFELELAHDLPYFIGDKMGMTSVALNLLENAVKYSGVNPLIKARLVQKNNQTIQLEVADQGIGIAEKEKKRVFDKFYRVGSEDTRTTKGTGLGLYIVDQIVKAHHGHIQIRDNPPRGTVFVIDLPMT